MPIGTDCAQTDNSAQRHGSLAARRNRASIAGESVEAAESDALPVSTVKVWATVYDQATIDAWNASGYIPAFLDGVQVDDVPLDQAVCDLDVIAPDASGEWYHLKMRVRSSDGAIAAVFMEPVIVPADPIPVDYPTGEPSRGCNGGPWWRRGRVCCFAQYLICSTVHRLFPHYCSQCAECFRDCMNCSVNNPCHSCGDCGGSQILCYFFGHC